MLVVSSTSVVLKKWQADDSVYNSGLIGGAIFGVCFAGGIYYLIGLFFGWIARRSRLVLSITLALLASLSTLGNSIVLYRTLTRTPPAVQAKIDKQFDQLLTRFEARSRTRFAAGDTSMDYEGMARLATQFRTLAEEYRGNDGEDLIGLAALYEDMSECWRAYSENLAKSQTTWPLDSSNIHSLADIEAARRDLKVLLDSTVTLRDLMKSPKVWVHDTLVAEGIDSPESESAFIRGFFQNPKRRSLQVQSFDTDIEFVETLLRMCDLLESQFGRWETEIGIVLFEDETSDQAWDDMITQIESLAIKQQTINQDYVKQLLE